MARSARERDEAFYNLARAGFTLDNIRRLLRLATTLTRLAEAGCNRTVTRKEMNQEKRAEAAARAIVETVPMARVRFNGDPRGYAIKIGGLMVDGKPLYNTWGRVRRVRYLAMVTMRDYLRICKFADLHLTLHMWDTHRHDHRGQTVIGYSLTHATDGVIFHGEDFSGSPLHSDDSDDTVRALLGFLTLRPGDTDRDYFDDYTPEQLAWCRSYKCEQLSMYAMDPGDGAESIPSEE